MRSLRVAPLIHLITTGGGEYHAHRISREQAAMGHDVPGLTIREDEPLSRVQALLNWNGRDL
jgi:hypothetical protein